MTTPLSVWGGPDDGGGRPPAAPACIPIWRPRHNDEVRGTVVSEAPVIVWTHWSDNKPTVCPGEAAGCIRCQVGKSKRWEAWLVLLPAERPGLRLAPVTAAAARASRLPHWSDPSVSWRGWRVRLFRLGLGRNAPIRIVGAEPVAGVLLPDPPADVAASIRRVYGIDGESPLTERRAH